MSEILGIAHNTNFELDPGFFESLLTSSGKGIADYSDTWIDHHVSLGTNQIYTTPQSLNEKMPYTDIETGCVIVADARIDYREELAEKLELNWSTAKDFPDCRLILNAFLKWGEQCVKYLYGDFAFAIWDNREKILTCARDQIGIKPLFYLHSEDYFAFSSSINGLSKLLAVNLKVKEKYIVDSLMLQQPDKSNTSYVGILKLEPATYLRLNEKNQINKQKYWELKMIPKFSELNELQAIEGLKKRMHQSVKERLRSAFKVGCELSGGLDSSSVATIAQSILKQKKSSLIAFTQSLGEAQKQSYFPFHDEFYYSTAISLYSDINERQFITGEDRGVIESIERTLIRLSQPYAPDYALLSDLLFEKAQEQDVRVVLSGFGGDEGVSSSNSTYYKDLANDKQWRLLYNQIRLERKANKLFCILKTLQILLRNGVQPLLGVIKKFLFYSGIKRERYKYIPLQKNLKVKYRTKRMFYKSKLEPQNESLRSRMFNRILNNYVTNRIESTTINSKAYKIEYRYPLLDVKLLEYFYSLPSHLKFENGINRYLFRMAAEGVLPDEIRWRNDKSGYTIPNVHYRIKIDEEKLRALIAESQAQNSFHYIDYKKLNKIFNKMLNREKKSNIGFGNMIFLTSIGILILQKWQRQGKIDIGIKC